MTLLLAFLIGLFAGLRALTAPAATAWAAHLGWLKLQGVLALIGSTPSVAIFTILAVLELVADKLPKTPSRTSPPGLIARIVMGGLTGACVAAGGGEGAFWRRAWYRRRRGGLFRRLPGAQTTREIIAYSGHLCRHNRGSSRDRRFPVGGFAILTFAVAFYGDSGPRQVFHADLEGRGGEMLDRAPVKRPGLVGDLRAGGIAHVVVVDIGGAGVRVFHERPGERLQVVPVTGKRL